MKNIIIVILVLILVGGAIWALSTRTQEEPVMPEEKITEEVEDKAADTSTSSVQAWQTYRNEEMGFEIKYPLTIKEDRISVIRENTVSLSYYCPPLPDPLIYNNFQIEIADNTAYLPIKTWIQQNELCGLKEDTFVDVTIAGAKGVSVEGVGGCPPGGAALNRKVYLVKNSKVYTIALYHELGQSEECAREAEDFFNQMLSSFRFIEGGKTAEEQACIDSGGTVERGMCCLAVSDFPNLCLIGACGCSPEDSHEVKICNCGEGRCFDGNTCVAIR